MARKKPKGPRKQPSRSVRGAAASGGVETHSSGKSARPTTTRPAGRDLRAFVYAGFDLSMAVLWAALLSTVLASRHGWASALLWSMVMSSGLMCAAMFVRNKWGWRVAATGCGVLLLLWLFVVVTLLMSAAYLAGVYGAFGRAASMGSLAVAALSVELVALVPALQLKFLMTRAGRRHFGQEPLSWR